MEISNRPTTARAALINRRFRFDRRLVESYSCHTVSRTTSPVGRVADYEARTPRRVAASVWIRDDQLLSERGERSLHLLQLRTMSDLEHAIDLRQMPLKPLRQFGFAYLPSAHCPIELDFRRVERRQFDGIAGHDRRGRNVTAILHECVEDCQQRIRGTLQGFLARLAERDCLPYIRECHRELTVVRRDRDWIPHTAPYLKPSAFLMASTVPVGRSRFLPCIGSVGSASCGA